MCGIAGGFFWGGRIPRDRARVAVESMVGAIAHRGPDGSGLFVSDPVDGPDAPFAVLGHRRLAIIDISDAGAQPMGGCAERPWVSFNGEIYNYANLRTTLERLGACFESHSDTETLLRGYEQWGPDVVQRLRGMFAFAMWDPRRKWLFIARDRLGIKPVYWYRGDGFVLFASEVRALLSSGLVPRRLDPTAVWQYLGYQSAPAPHTLVAGVRAMDPASWLTVSAGGEIASGTYWRMLGPDASNGGSYEDARSRVSDKLRDAVASHMVSDVPVAAFLSGGIDSSAVVALMRETGARPRTFSIGFDEQAFDESQHAALVAARFDAEHTHVRLSGDDLLAQLPGALAAMDQPSGDAVNTYVVSAAVRAQGIKVALSGLGGDEIFGGYPSFGRLRRITSVSRLWRTLPAAVRSGAAAVVRAGGGSSIGASKAAAMLASDGQVASLYPVLRQVLSPVQRRSLVSERVYREADPGDPYTALLEDAFRQTPGASTFAQISFAEARTYMHDVLLRDTDQMSMAHALEVRVPLLDHELVELVASLPDRHKWPDGTPKRLLVDAMGALLPREIVHRPKQGFTLPFEPWMRGPLRTFSETHLGPSGLGGRGVANPEEITRLWTAFLAGSREVSWSRLWVLVVLDCWLERHALQFS